MSLAAGQAAQPGDAFGSQRVAGPRCRFLDRGPKGLELRQLARKFSERLRPKQQFISVAHHARPTEVANAIDNFGGRRSRLCEVAAVED